MSLQPLITDHTPRKINMFGACMGPRAAQPRLGSRLRAAITGFWRRRERLPVSRRPGIIASLEEEYILDEVLSGRDPPNIYKPAYYDDQSEGDEDELLYFNK
jgi:hypothetical protein